MEQKPDISSTGAAKAESDPAYVNLKVKQQVCAQPQSYMQALHSNQRALQDGAITHFRIKRSTQMKKVQTHFGCNFSPF